MTTDRPIIQADPAVRFGQPHIRSITATIVGEHLQAGDPVETVTDEYGLTRADILVACWYLGTHGGREWRQWKTWADQWAATLGGHHGTPVDYDAIPDPPVDGA